MAQNRVAWIDCVKGVCLLLVFYIHHPDYVFQYSWLLTTAELAPFFVLSGYLHTKPLNGSKFSEKILYPFFVYGLLICLADLYIVYPMRNMTAPDYPFGGLLYGRHYLDKDDTVSLLTGDVGPMWFLLCFFIAKIGFNKFWLLARKWKCDSSVSYYGILIALMLIITILFYFCPYHLPWSIDVAPIAIAFMSSGYLIGKYYSQVSFKIFYIIGFLCVFAICAYYNGNTDLSSSNYGQLGCLSIILFYIEGVVFTFFLMAFFLLYSKNGIVSYFLSYIGKNSLRLLCIHGLVMNNLFAFLFDMVGLHRFAKLIILVPMLLLFSYLLGLIFQWLGKRFYLFNYL